MPHSKSSRYTFGVCVLSSLLLPTSCAHRTESNNQTPDEALFPLVIEQIISESGDDLRVDPRPLKPDPELLTLEGRIAEIAPSRVTAVGSPLLEVDSAFVERRMRTLARHGLPRADALRRSGCLGHMVPPSPEVLQQKREHCPQGNGHSTVILAIPRQGQDTAVDYGPGEARLDVWTVRAIEQHESRSGWVSYGVDYVFVRDGGWRFLKRKTLFVIE